MNKIPKEVLDVTQSAAETHPENVKMAKGLALKNVKRLAGYQGFVDFLVRRAVEDLVDDARHATNCRVRGKAGDYVGKGKTVSGSSGAVQRACASVYEFRIAGTILGQILGKDLEAIAHDENSIASGHLFRARLAEKLIPLVSKSKTVQQCVKEKKLQAIFQDVELSLGT